MVPSKFTTSVRIQKKGRVERHSRKLWKIRKVQKGEGQEGPRRGSRVGRGMDLRKRRRLPQLEFV